MTTLMSRMLMKGPSMQDVIMPTMTSGRGDADAAVPAGCRLSGTFSLTRECEVDAVVIGAAILTACAPSRKAASARLTSAAVERPVL